MKLIVLVEPPSLIIVLNLVFLIFAHEYKRKFKSGNYAFSLYDIRLCLNRTTVEVIKFTICVDPS